MMLRNEREYRHLVLVGGGHSHLIVLRQFAMRPLSGLRITLIAKESVTPYSGMLPGLVAGHFSFEDCHVDLARLANSAGARLVRDEACGVDLDAKQLRLQSGRVLAYDVLSLNCGSVARLPAGIPAGMQHVIAVRPVSGFLGWWRGARANPTKAVTVVGGGVGGVELALAMRWASPHLPLRLLDAGPEIAADLPLSARSVLKCRLAAANIETRQNFRVERRQGDVLISDTDEKLDVDTLVWAVSGKAPDWVAEQGWATDASGCVRVRRTLQSESHDHVFAAGDVATMVEDPRPKAGVYAVRQGPYLAENLRRVLLLQKLRQFRPQAHHLVMVALGDRTAVATRNGFSVSGPWVWRWKEHIDRKFMARFQESLNEPPMMDERLVARVAEVGDAEPQCVGCAAKLPAQTLKDALLEGANEFTQLQPSGKANGESAAPIGQESEGRLGPRFDDAAVVEVPAGMLVATVDGFPSLVSDPYLGAAIATQHSLGDVYAMGARPLGLLSVVSVPAANAEMQIEDLRQCTQGVRSILNRAQVPLLGGHSLSGEHLHFSMTALAAASASPLWLKRGLRPGDALILTKPIGTGVLFAAAMRGAAPDNWINRAFAGMLADNGPVVGALANAGVRAATDVTGFGLLGHLLEMAEQAQVSLQIAWDRVPVMDGAAHCMALGFASTLQRDNEKVLSRFELRGLQLHDVRVRLLVDPQTCGGLLLGVDADQLPLALGALQSAGINSANHIGFVCDVRRDGIVGCIAAAKDLKSINQ